MSETGLSLARYDQDIYAWALDQADLMRALIENRTNSPLDLENLLEEMEALARNYRSAVRSQTRRIIEHLLKLEFSRATDPRYGWERSVIEARAQLRSDLTPSLRAGLAHDLESEYATARKLAVRGLSAFGETKEAELIPGECPYSLDQIEADDWYPAPRLQPSNH